MARKKKAQGEEPAKKTAHGVRQKSGSARKTRGSKLCLVQAPMSGGRLIPKKGHYDAQRELREQLGGYEAMLAPPQANSRIKGQNNLMGLAVGAKESGGCLTGDLAITVFVRKKAPKSRVNAAALVPPEINGYPTDVQEIGIVRAFSVGSSPLPIPCGEPIASSVLIEQGTLGGLVTTDGKQCLISCNHVIANLNIADPGDSVVFIAPDGSLVPIATLYKWGILELDDASNVNVVDVAVAELIPGAVSPDLLGLALDSPSREAAPFDHVRKSGAFGVTLGLVQSVNAEIPVTMRGRVGGTTVNPTAIFVNQLFIKSVSQPFCVDGDSGSMIVLVDTNEPAGLLFAGLENGDCFANHISDIISTMQLTDVLSLSSV